jgi:large-conductance mechanosensitive channel
MISTIIGTAVSGLVAELISQLVKPITKSILNRNDQIKINYFDSELELDQIINKIVEFIFILAISFLIFRLVS